MNLPIRLRRLTLLVCALGVLGFAVAGCGSSSSSSSAAASTSASSAAVSSSSTGSISNTKAKFVLHAGLAFGAFHRWIYGPLKAGDFKSPLSHKAAVVKAGLAAAFVVHELKLALQDAQADATLSKLVAPITAVQTKLEGAVSSIKSGNVSSSTLQSLESDVNSIKGQASSSGSSIIDQIPSVL
jgi:hypothetical protein